MPEKISIEQPEAARSYSFETAVLSEQEKECFEELDEDLEFIEALQEIEFLREGQVEELKGGINQVFKITLDSGISFALVLHPLLSLKACQ